MPLASPEAFWPVIMGTSNRGVFDALSPDAQVRVRAFVEAELRRRGGDRPRHGGARRGRDEGGRGGSDLTRFPALAPFTTVARRPSLGSGGVLS